MELAQILEWNNPAFAPFRKPWKVGASKNLKKLKTITISTIYLQPLAKASVDVSYSVSKSGSFWAFRFFFVGLR